jgi:quercetin dioxygenase-like cupin family protein
MASTTTAFHALRHLPEEKITDQISRRILTGDKEMIVWWSMKAGAHAAAHQHPHEQIFWVTSGRMDIRIGSERRVCGAGEMGVIPGGVEHEVWFLRSWTSLRLPGRTSCRGQASPRTCRRDRRGKCGSRNVAGGSRP